MNILIDLLPTTVDIEGEEYEINSDFRTSILFEMMMQEPNLTENDKVIKALGLYYPKVPKNINSAIDQMLWFYRGGKDIDIIRGIGGNRISQIYSYEYDEDYIYSAFLDQYRVDLQDVEYLHWWKFKAMFKSLKQDNEIVKIMGYRAMDLSKIKDKNEREFYKKAKELYKIPTKLNKTEKEKIRDIEATLMGSGDLSSVLKRG